MKILKGNKTRKYLLSILLPTLMWMDCALADEQLFGYSQGAETMPQGTAQIYQWITQRAGRGQGSFSAQDYRTELEYGITDRLQTSLYLNARSFQIHDSAPIEEGERTYPNRNDSIRFDGVSMAFKYNVLSPFKPNKFGGIGLALYAEPGYSTIFNVTGESMYSPYLETKIIVQKNFLEDRLVTVFNVENAIVKRRFQEGDGLWQNDFEMNLNTGISYLVHQNWYLGLEGRYHSEYPQTDDVPEFNKYPRYGQRQQYVMFFGPNIHYTSKKFWATVTWLHQMKGDASSDNPAYYSGPLHLVDHERDEIRLKIAYNF